jgi:hypothetical protein
VIQGLASVHNPIIALVKQKSMEAHSRNRRSEIAMKHTSEIHATSSRAVADMILPAKNPTCIFGTGRREGKARKRALQSLSSLVF